MEVIGRAQLNWFHDYLPKEQLVIDASFLINILACGATAEIFSTLPQPCLVEEKVVGEIRRHPITSLCHVAALEALERSEAIRTVRMTDEEYGGYLSIVQAPLGQRLDAGESATLVVAKTRSLAVVLDENKARSFARERMPSLSVASTLKVFVSAAYRLNRDFDFLRNVVQHARLHGRMGVPKDEKELLSFILAK